MPQGHKPQPVDTSRIHLPQDLQELGEMLARNTHENYVYRRLSEGWTYGPVRDDAARQNPTLVPYEQLSEEEKEYDRLTSAETLKVLIALGYCIRKDR